MATITGTNSNDTLMGTKGETNLVEGLDGDDFLAGAELDDVLDGGAGNDTLLGGSGSDSAVYIDTASGYDISVNAAHQVMVTDIDAGNGDEGVDTLDVETIQFADRSWTVSGDFVISHADGGSQVLSTVTGLADGGFVVMWDTRLNGSRDIYGQRYSATGDAGEVFLISDTMNDENLSMVTSLSDGGFIVVWESSQWSDIYGQRFDAGGVSSGPFLISNSAIIQQAPTVTSLTDGGFVVTWQALDSGFNNVYGLRYDAAGVAGSEFVISNAADDQSYSTVTGLTDGGFVVTWQSSENGTDDIYGLRYDAAGVAGGEFIISNAANDQTSPTVTGLLDGGFVVTWTSTQNGDFDVYGRRYDVSGVAGGEFLIGNIVDIQVAPTVTSLLDGGFVVTWFSQNIDGDIHGERFDAAGVSSGEFVISNAVGHQESPRVTSLADGGFLVTWTSVLNGSADVYAQRYNVDGEVVTTGIQGSTLDDVMNLSASLSRITIDGGLGDDTITGGVGDDTLIGGAGTDTVVLAGMSVDYQIEINTSGQLVLTDINLGNGDEGTDTLSDIETLQFADRSWTVSAVDVQANTTTQNNQENASITKLSDGGFIITWMSKGQDSDDWGIYGQRYDSHSAAVGNEFQVNSTVADAQSDPSVANLTGGGFVVMWQSAGQDGDGAGIYGQLYDNTGAALGGEFLVNSTVANSQINVSVTGLSDGGFLATWQSFNQAGDDDGYGIFGQRYDSAGSLIDSEFQVNTDTSLDQVAPSVTGLSNGGFVVTWMSQDQIKGLVFNSAGVASAYEFLVNSSSGTTQNPSVSALSSGNFIVTWQSLNQDGDALGVYGQIFDNNGTVGSEFQINTTTLSDQMMPSITGLSTGGFVVVWQSLAQNGDGAGIFGQRYDEFGSALGNEFQINTFATGDQTQPSVTSLAEGGFVVSWTSADQDGDGNGIYYQRFNSLGEPVISQLTGSALNDVMDFSANANGVVLSGGLGDDTFILGTSTANSISEQAGEGIDTVTSSLSHILSANVENLIMTGTGNIDGIGNTLDNVLTGNSGNNLLDGRFGADTMQGGDGDDTYIVDDVGDVVVENSNEGVDIVHSSISYILGADVENLTLTGTGYIDGTGNNANNIINGNGANNILMGDDGDDVLDGGAGTDTANYFGASSSVDADLQTGVASGGAGNDTLINIENLQGSTYDDSLTGDSTNNILDGSFGADTLQGGDGDDTYFVEDAGDVVSENSNQGTDTVYSGVSFILDANLENLSLTGSDNIDGTGNSLNNIIDGNGGNNILTGNDGNDALSGNDGDDSLDGGAGVDTASYFYASAGVDVSLQTGSASGGAGNDTLTGIENLEGSGYDDTLSGDSNNNQLDGSFGIDTLQGGDGNDIYIVDDAADTVIENGNEGIDTVQSGANYTLNANVENLYLSGASDINGTGNNLNNEIAGNSGDNVLTGGDGNDTLSGGGGSDLLLGGSGDDVYFVDSLDVKIDELEGGDLVQINTSSIGTPANRQGEFYQLSADDSQALFASDAYNLTAGDSGSYADIFIKNLTTGITIRVSEDSVGTEANGDSFNAAFSADDLNVVFESEADNLVAGDTNNVQDIFIKDLTSQSVVRVSTNALGNEADGDSFDAHFSTDGLRVIFDSEATNLVAGDTNAYADVFIKTLADDSIIRVSVDASGNEADGDSDNARLSDDGNHVLFESTATNLIVGSPTSGSHHLFVKNLSNNSVQLVSADASGIEGNGYSYDALFSADGSKVLFTSSANNLVAGDSNGQEDIFLKDLTNNSIIRLSTDSTGNEGTGRSANAHFSADGTKVIFTSDSALVADDTNGSADVYVKDLVTGVVTRVSTDNGGSQISGDSFDGQLTSDNSHVVFTSRTDNLVLGDTNNRYDFFIKEINGTDSGGNDTMISLDSLTLANNIENLQLIGSADVNGVGNALANTLIGNSGNNQLDGGAGNDQLDGNSGTDTLIGGAGDDVYTINDASVVVDETGFGAIIRVSTSSAGALAHNGDSALAQFSVDGTKILFQSDADDLVSGDNNGTTDVFVKSLTTGALSRISLDAAGAEANGTSGYARFAADGNSVIFESTADNLVANDTNSASDVFIKNLVSGNVVRVSTDLNGVEGDGDSYEASLSVDGSTAVFGSNATNLIVGDTNGFADVFIKDLQLGTVTRISTDAAGNEANGNSFFGEFAADGISVLFESYADNLVGGDSNGYGDIFIKNRNTQDTIRINTDASGAEANGESYEASFSADGTQVIFTSQADNLVSGDTNGVSDIFVKDIASGAIVRVSTNALGDEASGSSFDAHMSADGHSVIFTSFASDLVADDNNLLPDIFIKNLLTGAVQRLSVDGSGQEANNFSTQAAFSADGSRVIFTSFATNLQSGDSNNASDIYIKNLQGQDTGGLDTVFSSVSYILSDYVDNLNLTGVATIDGTGNNQANTLTGNSANNALDGGAGSDTLAGGLGDDSLYGGLGNDLLYADMGDDFFDGGTGTDTIDYSLASAGIVADFQTGTASSAEGNDSWISVENLIASNYNDSVTGDTSNNNINGQLGDDSLYGGLGNDVLYGGLGNDLLNGGAGTDIVSYLLASAGVVANLQTGTSSGGEGNDSFISIENLIGSDYNDSLTGDATNNSLNGLLGDDSLNGGLGNDTLFGGLGDDNFDGGAGTDTVIYSQTAAAVTVDLQAGTASGGDGNDSLTAIENLIGSNYNDSLTGDSANNNLNGLQGNDILIGDTGNDVLNGGLGNDSLYGGLGNDAFYGGLGDDVFDGDTGTDTVLYSLASAGIVADLQAGTVSGAEGNDNLIGIENLIGSNYNDSLTGDGANNNLNGQSGNDSIYGDAGNDALNGGVGNDSLYGGLGNDAFYGGVGDDFIDGGAGTDTIIYSLASAGISVDLQAGTGSGAEDNDSVTNIENLIGSNYNDSITGDATNNNLNGQLGDDSLYGGLGNDVLYGGLGDDLFDGGAGTDIVVYSQASAGVSADLQAGIASGAEGNDSLTGIENLNGSNYNDSLIGDAANNSLNGLSGDDTLVGGAGIDALNGGAGNDSLYGGLGNDALYGGFGDDLFDGGAGTDTVYYSQASAAVSVDLQAGTASGGDGNDSFTAIENLIGSIYNDSITGDGANNNLNGQLGDDSIYGGLGNDALYGGLGDDSLDGGAGTDTVIYSLASAGVVVDLQAGTASGGDGNDSLTGIENLMGSTYNDSLMGDAANNNLTGQLGDDSLYGGFGNDTLYGGLGDDLFDGGSGTDAVIYSLASAGIVADLQAGTASGGEGNDSLTGIENLTGSNYNDNISGDTANNSLTGLLGDDTLVGDAGNDVLNGGLGNDSLYGGMGNDAFYGGLGDDLFDGGAGTDTVIYSLASAGVVVDLQAGTASGAEDNDSLTSIENLIGSNYNDSITGDAANNNLNGQLGDDSLYGGLGNDALYGGLGDDSFNGGAGTDTVIYTLASAGIVVDLQAGTASGGEGNDSLTSIENLIGSTYNDSITGDAANNNLTGQQGDDSLSGGLGNDTLSGGLGNDTYTVVRGGGIDTIIENDSTVANIDTVLFGATIARDQIWLKHVGNNLEVSIIGTTDKAVLKDWYLGSAYHSEKLQTAAGNVLLDTNVQNLVTAMASITPPTLGQTTLSASQHTALDSFISANWS